MTDDKTDDRVIRVSGPRIEPKPTSGLHWWWIGLHPTIARVSTHVRGIELCRWTESVHREPGAGPSTSKTIRHRHPGVVIKLAVEKVRELAKALDYKVARPITHPNGVSDTLIISIPTPEEIAAVEKERAKGRYRRTATYIARPGDTPLADHVFVQYLPPDRARLRPADVDLPAPVSETGIELPPPDAPTVPENVLPQGHGDVFIDFDATRSNIVEVGHTRGDGGSEAEG